jgi:phosphatidylglycerol:prolipoprotein diacylglycerol transferase
MFLRPFTLEHEHLPFPDIDPIAFAIGPVIIRWYALAYLFGVALGVSYGAMLLSRTTLWRGNTPPFKTADWIDFGFWAVLGIVVGGRLGYVLFYDPVFYLSNPMQILQTWDGGMSFHGGRIGIVLAMIVYTYRKGGDPLSGLDILGAVSPIGLMLGRFANFVNGELYGRETSLPWGVVFPNGGDVPRHPSQLYEAALEGIVLFLFLRYITHVTYGLRKPGLTAGVFGIGYALARIGVETVRLPDADKGYLYGGWLTYGMVLSVPILLAGVALVVYANRKQARA